METKTITAQEWGARQAKSARWAAYFRASGLTSEMVSRMGLHAPEWGTLAAAITKESGRKIVKPNSQETVDLIVRCLREFEGGSK